MASMQQQLLSSLALTLYRTYFTSSSMCSKLSQFELKNRVHNELANCLSSFVSPSSYTMIAYWNWPVNISICFFTLRPSSGANVSARSWTSCQNVSTTVFRMSSLCSRSAIARTISIHTCSSETKNHELNVFGILNLSTNSVCFNWSIVCPYNSTDWPPITWKWGKQK